MTATDTADFIDSLRRLVEQKVVPHAAHADATSTFPQASWDALAGVGVPGMPCPVALKGSDADFRTQIQTMEEIARGCSTTATTLVAHWGALHTLLNNAGRELKQVVIPELAEGSARVSFCLSEPESGSDLAGLRSKAVRDGEGWRINAHKRFITGGGQSVWYAVLVPTAERAFGVFLVHRDDEGVSFGPPESKMGLKGSATCDVILDDVWTPDSRVVGDPTQGYAYMMKSLTYTRPLVAAQALGVAQAAFEATAEYVKSRQVFGSALSRFQMTRERLADMAREVEAARALLHHAVSRIIEGDPRSRALAAMAKVQASDTAMRVTTDAVQLHGGYGYLSDYVVERLMRDAKITQIYEGANEIQKLLIAKAVIGD